MKKAIVTGANGFVGGATLRELLHHGYEVWAVGHQDHFSNVPEDPNVHKVSCDLAETKTLPEKIPTCFITLPGPVLPVRQERTQRSS